ncbi:MAG: hydroxyacid dehydrogenase [Armatimonadetes bacterium]|nr:hydroxyacid dehydrogenase [Armatimonadota bacterium]
MIESIHEEGMVLLRAAAEVVELPEPSPPEVVRAAVADADAVVVRLYPVTAALIEAAPKLRVIGRHGVGVDTVDVATATRRGVAVVYTPGANSQAVAEHALTLMLAVAKQIVMLDRDVREGRFGSRRVTALDLDRKVLGLVGVGQVGRRVAGMCRGAFEMRVLAYDPYVATPLPGVTMVRTLHDLLAEADIVSVHAPLTPETRGLIAAAELARMKPTAILINTARGPIVDEVALAEALRAGRIAGAGLDVFAQEPVPAGHPLLGIPNAVLTPHSASRSEGGLRGMARMVAEGVVAVLRGEQPPAVANPEACAHLRPRQGA